MNKPVVILCHPKIHYEENYAHHWLPYSLLTVAQPLVTQDLAQVVLFDGNSSKECQWDAVLDQYLSRALCIGFSIMTGGGQIENALKLAALARKRSYCPPLVFGGPHVNVAAEETVEHALVDAVLTGPGQVSMPIFVRSLLGEGRLGDVPGLIFKQGAAKVIGPANPAKAALIGRYPWRLLDVESYIIDDPTISKRTINYVSSQGCVYQCGFCYEATYRSSYSYVRSEVIVEDLQWLMATYGIDGVKFYDADFFANLNRIELFLNLLLRTRLSLRWAASISPMDLVRSRRANRALLPLIAKSGCTRLLMGLESGSDRVLKEIIGKRVTCSEIWDVAQRVADYGILGAYTLIVGFPSESQSEREQTYILANQLATLNPRPEIKVHLYAPYPGTPLFENALKKGFVPPTTLEEWSDYNYYKCQTPWADEATEEIAKCLTYLRSTSSE